ncbi:MAG: hypothetical protein F6K65_18695 [Moorea sp. SIO3C2]|nr:hypothetical protein [Moorena sp. SIO3C2]
MWNRLPACETSAERDGRSPAFSDRVRVALMLIAESCCSPNSPNSRLPTPDSRFPIPYSLQKC